MSAAHSHQPSILKIWWHWIKVHRYWVAVTVITILAAVLRLYRVPSTIQFLGDEGRDALVVSRIFRENDLVFIGPVTSVGNMYLGPLYYYFMVPWLWITYPSPVGPAYAIAVLGILSVFLMYHWGKTFIGENAAITSAAFLATAATAVIYSRFSWNPNPAPLVGAFMVWATYKAVTKNTWWWVGVATAFAVLIQLHYLALLSAGGAGLCWLYQLWQSRTTIKNLRLLGVVSILSALVILVSLTPLALFDWKHDGLNSKAFLQLFSREHSFKEANSFMRIPHTILEIAQESHGRSLHIFFEHSIGKERTRNTVLLVLLLAILGIRWYRRPQYRTGIMVLTAYVGTTILGSATYQHTIFDHYVLFIFPTVYWLLGSAVDELAQTVPPRVGATLTACILAAFIAKQLPRWPLHDAGWTINDIRRTADDLYSKLPSGEPYALVLLSSSKDLYGMNYRYFLSAQPNPPVAPEQTTRANYLVIINEEHRAQPIDEAIYEIHTFPSRTIETVYTVDQGPEILILSNKPQTESGSN